jgi:hypothetical protein
MNQQLNQYVSSLSNAPNAPMQAARSPFEVACDSLDSELSALEKSLQSLSIRLSGVLSPTNQSQSTGNEAPRPVSSVLVMAIEDRASGVRALVSLVTVLLDRLEI